MSRILIAWELGANLGHVTNLVEMARALHDCGHQVAIALRDLTNAARIARAGFTFLPAPVLPMAPARAAYDSYAAMLLGEAFPSARAAFAGALAWRSIYRALRPDVLVADHAPLALLAARGTRLRTLVTGVPFCAPPAGRPLPRFGRAGAGSDEQLLARLNNVLAVLRAPVLAGAADLYGGTAALAWLPEMDYFGPRPSRDYAGPLIGDAGGAEPPWPGARGPKVLVYLRRGDFLAPLLKGLQGAGCATLMYIPGTRSEPLRMSALLPQCDAVVCHGGNLSAAAALAGKPLLLLPGYIEQQLTARRAAELGIAAIAPREPDWAALGEALRPEGVLARAAARLARRQPARLRMPLDNIVRCVEGRRDGVAA